MDSEIKAVSPCSSGQWVEASDHSAFFSTFESVSGVLCTTLGVPVQVRHCQTGA